MAQKWIKQADGTFKPAGTTVKKWKKKADGTFEEVQEFNSSTALTAADSADQNKRTWLQKGAFSDGYQFGDVSRTVLGTYNDVRTNFGAGVWGMGEKAVDAGAYVVGGIAGLLGNDKLKNDMREFIKKDLYDEKALAEKYYGTGPEGWLFQALSKAIGADAEKGSVLGDRSDSVVESGGQLAGTMALSMLHVPWWVTSGVTSFGSEAENALNEGATYGQAGASAAISAGAEILSEGLFGGSGLGEKGLINLEPLTKGISNKVVKTLADYGVDLAAEGSEEVVSEVFSRLGSSLYKEENLAELLTNEEAVDSYIESFIGGAALGGIMNAGKAYESAKTGRDYRTGWTQNEQKVAESITEERIAESEKNGKKLKAKEKAAIREQVGTELSKGYISTDAIEKVLGGEAYQTYESLSKEAEEYNTLNRMKAMEMTGEQADRLAELKEKNKTNSYENELKKAKDNLLGEMDRITQKDMFLRESYNEYGRRSEAYQIDESTKYTDAQRAVVQKAADSGILNNTRKTHEFVDMIAKISADKGVSFDFANNQKLKESGFGLEGKTVNGFAKDGSITLNIQSNKTLSTVVGHEITHVLEGSELYNSLQQAVKEYATTKGEYDSRLQELNKLYEGVEGANVENELTADLVGEYLFTDEGFVKNLSTKHQNLFQKIFSEIKYLLKAATAGSKEARQLEKVKKVFEEAYRDNAKAEMNTDIQYSLVGQDENGIEIYETSEDTKKLSYAERKAKLLDTMRNEYAGRTAKFTKNGETYYAQYNVAGLKKGVYGDKKSDLQGYNAKINIGADGNYIELAENALYTGSSEEQGKSNAFYKDAKSWDYYEKTIRSDGKYYDVLINVKDTGNHQYVYDITLKEATHQYALKHLRLGEAASKSSISQNQQNASGNSKKSDGTRYSLNDSTGRKLSAEQQEYFKDSKVRDENGNLMVMYHGTPNGDFTVFRDGTYFTSSREYADTYQSPSASSISVKKEAANPKTYEVYLNITKPFDIRNPEARDIYINEYIKGGNAAGINPYLPDAEYAKIKSVDWVEGMDLQEFLVDNGYDYDGLILDEGGTGGYGEDVKSRGISYVVFNPEQVKNIDNLTPTTNRDIRYSLSTNNDVEGMTEKEYNHHGWAKVNDVLTQQELADFQQKVGEKAKNGQNWYMNLEDGRYMFAVGRDGVNSTLIISDGDFQHPSIDKVYHIDADNETDIEVIRDGIYSRESRAYSRKEEAFSREKKGKWSQSSNAVEKMLRDGLISEYGKSDFFTLRELRGYDRGIGAESEGNTGSSGNLQNGRRSNQKTRIDLSLSDKVSSDDGIFFNGKNANSRTDGWNVRGEDIALEDIGPVRKDIATKEADTATENREIAPVQQEGETTENRSEWDVLEEWLNEANKLNEMQQEDTHQDSKPTVKQRNAAKLEKYESQLQSLQESAERRISKNEELLTKREVERRDLERSYDAKIEAKQKQYEAKKNKDTKAANELLSQLYNLEARKETRLSECDKDIKYYEAEIGYVRDELNERSQRLQKRIDKMNSEEFRTAEQRQVKQEELRNFVRELIGDTSTWKDKKIGLFYQINTLQRNLRDIVRDSNGNKDIARADAIYDAIQGIYNRNEAMMNREANRIKQIFRDMKINKDEDKYIQMLGEYRHNPDTTLTAEVMDEYYNAHKDKINMATVESAITEARKVYDSLFYRVNQVLKEHGFKEMGYREGYFPHFIWDKQSRLGKLLNWKTQSDNIPTDIAGLTENFNPQRSWQSFNKHRTGDVTDYSFEKGLDSYVHGALDWIYHIEDIQKRRALENEIRYEHSDAGVKEQLDAIYKNEEYDADQMQEEIDKVLKKKNNPLNNFVTDFRNATNNLAGKKSSADRGLEYATSRKIYSTMTNISNRVSANMVAGSISSALTNFIPITQSWAAVSPVRSLQAMRDTLKNYILDDGTIEKSDYLTNRLNAEEKLYQTGWDKASHAAGILMDAIDGFTSQVVWRSKYLDNIKNGMSELEAVKNADYFSEGLMAGRSRGNMPTIFNSKNPLVKAFTAFQLEVVNQYGYMFKDLPQDIGSQSKAKLIKGYAAMYLGAYVYNALSSMLTGRDAATDPIGILVDLLRDLGAFDDDDDEPETNALKKAFGIYDNEVEKDPLDAVFDLGENVAGELPFVGGILGGGRIPINSAIPYGDPVSAVKESITDISEGEWKKFTSEWLNVVYYGALPFGGAQLKKTINGLSMFDDDLPVSGSYTNSGDLRFPVEDTVGNRIQAGIFGQYANENARDYFDGDRSPLNEKKIQEYKDLDISIQDYWNYLEGLKGKTKMEEKTEYIAGLDLPVSKKNIMINNVSTREDPIDLTGYENFEDYEEFDFSLKNPEKYEFLKENDISYKDYNQSEESRKAYNWAYQNPDKYEMAKAAAGDVTKFREYAGAIDDITADKNNFGQAVSGSRKRKVASYINGLDLTYSQKLILYKSVYPSDDRYNQEIIDYLNSRNDISYHTMESILKALDFTVEADGTVRW